jgi:WD40 repeat protein
MNNISTVQVGALRPLQALSSLSDLMNRAPGQHLNVYAEPQSNISWRAPLLQEEPAQLPVYLEQARTHLHVPKTPIPRYLAVAVLHPNLPYFATLQHASETDDDRKHIKIWNFSNPKQVVISESLTGHENRITIVAFNNDGSLLASGSIDGSVKLWRFSPEIPTAFVSTIQHDNISCIAFCPNANFLVTCTDKHEMKLWRFSLEDNTIVCLQTCPGNPIWYTNSVAFDPTGRYIATGSTRVLMLWIFSPDGNFMQVPGQYLYNINTEDFDTNTTVWSVAFHPDPDKNLLAAACGDNTTKLLNFSDNLNTEAILTGHSGYVTSVAFHPTNLAYVATGSNDKTVKLWNISNLRKVSCIYTVDAHVYGIICIAYNNNGILATSSYDGSVKLWDINSDKLQVVSELGNCEVIPGRSKKSAHAIRKEYDECLKRRQQVEEERQREEEREGQRKERQGKLFTEEFNKFFTIFMSNHASPKDNDNDNKGGKNRTRRRTQTRRRSHKQQRQQRSRRNSRGRSRGRSRDRR